MALRFGPFTLDLADKAADQGDWRDPSLSEGIRAAGGRSSIERPECSPRASCSRRLWPDTFVAEANLSNLVAEIRDALGDRARSPLFVRTVHGFGYAFCGSVDDDAASAGPSVSAHRVLARMGPPPVSTRRPENM